MPVDTETDTRDRTIRMEAEFASMKREFEEMRGKVDQIHSMLTQASGAKKAVGWLVAFGGSSVLINFITNFQTISAFLKSR